MQIAVENRKNPRYAIRLSAEVAYNGKVFTAVTRDLSIGGLCLETDRLLPEGQALQMGLFLVVDDVEDANTPVLEMRGKVAWAAAGDEGRPSTMGIRFEALSASQMAGLNRLLKLIPAASAA